MSKIHEKCSADVTALITECMAEQHQHLLEHEVKVVATFVLKLGPEDELVPCLRCHGAMAAAVIRLTRGAIRLRVDHDAEVTIDKAIWLNLQAPQRKALIDHELTHLALVKDKTGAVKTDEYGHARLRLIQDDYSMTGFYSIAARYGVESLEYKSLKAVTDRVNEALVSIIMPQSARIEPFSLWTANEITTGAQLAAWDNPVSTSSDGSQILVYTHPAGSTLAATPQVTAPGA